MEQNGKGDQKNDTALDWVLRPCEIYKEEYSDCTSMRARFHQYFIFGETQDCTQWKKDYDNCYKWNSNQDLKAKNALIQSEQQRRHARLKAHNDNKIWEKRDEPPADWNSPLPEWMVERNKDTYLDIKARKLRGENVDDLDFKGQLCTIM